MGFNPAEPRKANGEWTKDETRAWLKRHPVDASNVVDMWDQATPGEKTSGEVWYPHAHMVAQALGKRYGVSTQEAAGLLATYSPQTAWGQNIRDAAEALRENRPLGGPGERIWWDRGTNEFPTENREGIMAPGVSKKRAAAIMAGQDPDEVFAGGRNKNGSLKPNALKIRAFSALIANGTQPDPEHPKVVIDRHAAGVARGVRFTEEDYNVDGPSTSMAKFGPYVEAYKEAARRISEKEGRTVPPEAVQAVTWLTRQRLNSNMESQVGKTRDKLGKQDAAKLAAYIDSYLPEARTYLPQVGYSDLTRHHARPTIDLAVQRQPKPQQQVQQPQQSPADAVALIAAALLAGGSAATVLAAVTAILAPFRIGGDVVEEVMGIVDGEHLPAPVENALPGPVHRAPTRNLFFRAAYIANAAHRIARSVAKGNSLASAVSDERRFLVMHEKASQHRMKAAEQVQTAAEFFGIPEEGGTLVGWYLNPLLNNEAECIAANGHNFHAEHGTVIGLPGSVHSGCGCYAGPPWTGAAMVNDVMRNIHVLHKVGHSRAKFRLKEVKGA
jgi:hypothetical protein